MRSRRMSGMAMVVVLGIVVVLSMVVAFAITMSGRERSATGKFVHNLNIQELTESTLQRARGYFAINYGPNGTTWNTYLAYFVDHPVILAPTPGAAPTLAKVNASILTLTTDHPELLNPNVPSGFACWMYLRDNPDEFPPLPNNPRQDNDLLVYVGAVCVQTQVSTGSNQQSPLIAELTAPLLYNPTAQYSNQGSGGTQGLNNASQVAAPR